LPEINSSRKHEMEKHETNSVPFSRFQTFVFS